MKKTSLTTIILCLFLLKSNAQKFENNRAYMDADYSLTDDTMVKEMIQFYVGLIKEGSIKVYNNKYTDKNFEDRPLNAKEFEQVYLHPSLSVTTNDENIMQEKTNDQEIHQPIKKIRILSDLTFNKGKSRMSSQIKEIDFLTPVITPDGTLLGYINRFYIKF
jgi:hypothetical protein